MKGKELNLKPFKRSAASILIEEHLIKIAPGDQITFAEINKVIGFNCQERRGPLTTALKHLRLDHQMNFRSVRGVGYVHSKDCDIKDDCASQRRRVRNSGVKLKQINQSVKDFSALSEEGKNNFELNGLIAAATIELCGTRRGKKALANISKGRSAVSADEMALILESNVARP